MTTSAGIEVGLCTKCGTALSGKFCSGCGTPTENAPPTVHSEGWDGLAHQFLASPSRNGIFSVALAFLRHPVDTIIRLTDDPTYRSHWSFLTAMVGTQLTLVYVILPRVLAAILHTTDQGNSSAVLTNEIIQYVGMAILTPIQYYACRALGTLRRTPMSYVKLCVLSVSYCSLLSCVVLLLFFATALAILEMRSTIQITTVWQGLSVAMVGVVLAFVAASHKRFWGMTWPIAIGLSLAIGVLSWSVVYPALTSLAESTGVTGTFAQFLG